VTASRLVCAACGAQPAPREPYPFRCPNAGRGDDLDHVLRRELTALSFPADSGEENPFLRFRTLLHAWHAGLEDGEFVALVRRLDDAVARVDGHGFRITPFARNATLSDELGFSSAGGVWVKDETGNVSGSHKARHLFGVLVWLETAERLGLTGGGCACSCRSTRSRPCWSASKRSAPRSPSARGAPAPAAIRRSTP
jgi:threonine synthase